MIIKITKEEILATPNDQELGTLVRNKMWQEERNERGPQFNDEHFGLIIGDDGLVKGIVKPDEYEVCVMCGEKTDVLKSTDINFRIGYVEGAGQLCLNCYNK
jgi:hypothetical protein